jgi:hypothetical protein
MRIPFVCCWVSSSPVADAIEYYSNANHNGTLYMNNEANDPGLAGIFATYPAPWLSIAGGIGDQVLSIFFKIQQQQQHKST